MGPLIREPDGTVYPSARVVPTLTGGALHALLGSVWSTNPWTAAYRQDRMEPSERVVGWLSGSCLLLRRTAFDAIGGFDPRYFMYMEDVDLGDRLARAGWQNVYAPSSEVVHAKGHAAGRDPARSLGAHHDSVYIFQSDRHPHCGRRPCAGAFGARWRPDLRLWCVRPSAPIGAGISKEGDMSGTVKADAVILVGGQGTRLRPLTLSAPKPMLPIAGFPFLTHVLSRVAAAGIDHVVLGTSYKADVFESEFGDGSSSAYRSRTCTKRSRWVPAVPSKCVGASEVRHRADLQRRCALRLGSERSSRTA